MSDSRRPINPGDLVEVRRSPGTINAKCIKVGDIGTVKQVGEYEGRALYVVDFFSPDYPAGVPKFTNINFRRGDILKVNAHYVHDRREAEVATEALESIKNKAAWA